MVKVDSKEIPFYSLDTLDTFIRRVAVNKNTLPEYLVFDPELTLDVITKTKKTSSKNLLQLAIESPTSFAEWYSQVKPMFPKVANDDLAKIYLTFNESILESVAGSDQLVEMIIFSIQDEMEKLNIKIDSKLYDFWKKDKKEFLKKLQGKVAQIKKTDQDLIEVTRTLTTAKQVTTTPFIYDQVKIWYPIINLEKTMPEQIFNDIHPTFEAPLATINNIFKISEDISDPPVEWRTSMENILIIKVLRSNIITPLSEERNRIKEYYNDMFVMNRDNKLLIGIGAKLESHEMDTAFTMSRFKSILRTYNDFEFGEGEFESISGSVLMADIDFDKFIFADEAMINPVFSNYISVDESKKASKKRSSVFVNFFDPSRTDLGAVFISITGIRVMRNDKDIRQINDKDKTHFPLGSNFVKIKILRAQNKEAVDHSIDILSRLFSLYKNDQKNIIETYRKYIPDFATKNEEDLIIETNEKYIASDLFVSNYTRSCSNKPRLIEKDEANDLKQKGIQVIQFPKTEAEGNQHYYSCDEYVTHPYVGLRVNKLSNKDKYPYIPCCFKTDQTVRKATPYRVYYLEEELQEETAQQRIITTNKFTGYDKFGDIPKNIEKLLKIFDNSYEYLRKGVTDTKSSFLECILQITDPVINKMTEEERIEHIKNERNILARNITSVIFQSNYGENDTYIQETIKDSETYLDPERFSEFFSNHYGINIYLMKREHEKSEGHIVYPRSKWVLFTPKQESNISIIIYEHLGNESDNARYPRCELIVKWTKGTTEVLYSYSLEDPLVKGLKKLYNSYTSYSQDCNQVLIPSIDFNGTISSQYIDNYGKSRGIILDTDKGQIGLITEPLPIFETDNLISYEQLMDFTTNSKVLKKYVEKIGASFLGQNKLIYGMEKYEISFTYENYLFTAIIEKPLQGVEITSSRNISLPLSISKSFAKLHQSARYIQSLCLYCYSKSLNNNQNVNIDRAIQWTDKGIVIDPDHDLEVSSPVLNGNIVKVDSEETKNRLIYYLVLMIQRKPEYVKNYRNNIWAENFFQDVLDYDEIPNTYIFNNSELFTRKKNNYEIYNHIVSSRDDGYFFKNSKVMNDKVVLILPAKNINHAIDIASYYKFKGIVSDDTHNINTKIYNIYLYQSSENIKIKRFNGATNESQSILTFKKNGQLKFFAVIPCIC
jgi:hypothetical protein